MMNKRLLAPLLVALTTTIYAQTPSEVGATGKITVNYQGKSVAYTTVKAKDGKIWLQQNLGSTRVAKTISDNAAFGHYFVWGRWDDGHQLRPTPATEQEGVPTPNNPGGLAKTGGNPFYFTPDNQQTNYFWIAGKATDTWTAASPNSVTETDGCDPCKQLLGKEWRVPTKADWETVLEAEKITDRETAFDSNLKIVAAGYYAPSNAPGGIKNIARLWSSTAANGGRAYILRLQPNNPQPLIVPIHRASAYSVRCIKDELTK